MGAHVLTRIYNSTKTDYIDLHDGNSDGDIEAVKKELKQNASFWERFVEQMEEDIINSDFDFINLMQWAENFENFIKVNQHFPCIEASAAMMSMRSFNNHHVMPHYNKDSKQLLDFWGYSNPTLTAVHKGHTTSFITKNKELKLEPKAVDLKEFKIVRVQTMRENGQQVFVDVKVRNFDKKEFLFHVLSLPEFWRNFHFLTRKKKNNMEHRAYNLNRSLTTFYTPSKNFTIQAIVGKNKREIFENVKTRSPLSLYVNSFAMHLFFSLPGLALPLTSREQLWSAENKPEMTITLNENELNLITISYGEDTMENKQTLQEFSDGFSEREQAFARFFELGKYSGGQFLLTTNEEFAFVYETNMIELFDSLTKIDQHTT